MYKKDYNFNCVNFSILCKDEETLDKQTRHISQFYINSSFEDNQNENINIEYIEDKDLYLKLLESVKLQKYRRMLTFDNQVHKKYNFNGKDLYVIDTEEYICLKENDNAYKVITDGRLISIKWPFRILREILLRKEEENKYLTMHGTSLSIDDKGICLLGNKGSGKTSLAIKMIEGVDYSKFMSNDRVFINKDLNMNYFPIPIVFAMGTVKNSKNLDKYFLDTRILEKRANIKYEDAKCSDKVDIPLTDMSKIYENLELKDNMRLDTIIFPNISKNGNICLNDMDDKEKLIKLFTTCFSIFDFESKRLEWVYNKKLNMEENYENIIDTFNTLIKQINMIKLNYNIDDTSEEIIKVLRKEL